MCFVIVISKECWGVSQTAFVIMTECNRGLQIQKMAKSLDKHGVKYQSAV